jgi:AcrR family transcriptional regulator
MDHWDPAVTNGFAKNRPVILFDLSELMKNAGFTQGGFYNHFESKADLVAEVLASAIAEGIAEFAKLARAPVVDCKRNRGVPVRVSLDHIPADETLVAGRTATVEDPVAEANWPSLAFWARQPWLLLNGRNCIAVRRRSSERCSPHAP